jgi:hypothetical protein
VIKTKLPLHPGFMEFVVGGVFVNNGDAPPGKPGGFGYAVLI